MLAQEAGYPDEGLETLEFGAFLHDIGKIGIRDAVLLKPGPLDETEWVHMREHPVKGFEIASKIEMLLPIMSAVRNHHERWDGNGQPDGHDRPQTPGAVRHDVAVLLRPTATVRCHHKVTGECSTNTLTDPASSESGLGRALRRSL